MKNSDKILLELLRRALEIPGQAGDVGIMPDSDRASVILRSSRRMTEASSRGMTEKDAAEICIQNDLPPSALEGGARHASGGRAKRSGDHFDANSQHQYASLSIADWSEIYRGASYQGVLGVLWDGVKDLPMDKGLKFNWALNVEKIEAKYKRQLEVIEEIAGLFAAQGLDMMLIKGYGLSLLYPEPSHRPCGDIDFYLYGQYAKGDKILEQTHNLTTDLNKHHHTVNYYKGVMLENHYDFLNIESHLSNKIIEQRLIEEVQKDRGDEHILPSGQKVYTPCPEFNALFLLRHAAAHFAAERIGLRHLVDWALFLKNYAHRVDWNRLYDFSREMGMERFLFAINTIAVEQLGVDGGLLPEYPRDHKLEERVLDEILSPGFKKPMPKTKNPLAVLPWKLQRWTKNAWKNRIVYRESLVNQFFVLWMSHIFKPTLKDDRK